MAFQIHALTPDDFKPLFQLSDAELQSQRARRVTATSSPGFPCRVSLEDAAMGETLILAWCTHHDADTPYRASHAVYVREGAVQARPAPDEIPAVLTRRPISVRAFNAGGDMVHADLAEGEDQLRTVIEALLDDAHVAELHLHNAKPGCYAARATRA